MDVGIQERKNLLIVQKPSQYQQLFRVPSKPNRKFTNNQSNRVGKQGKENMVGDYKNNNIMMMYNDDDIVLMIYQ